MTATARHGNRINRDSAVPLWQQVRRDVARRLDAGEFNAAFPGEIALQSQYGVSRHTVREALRSLRDDGIITAARGQAPRVATVAEIEQPLGALYSLFASTEAAGLDQVSVVRTIDIRADGVVADRLGLEGSTPLFHLERLRLAGDEPLAIDRVWLPSDVARPLLSADFTRTGLYVELARRCSVRVNGGQEHLRAVVPSPAERRLLGLAAGTAAFAVDRLGLVDGVATEWRHTLVRGDRFAVSARFSDRTGYGVDLTGHHAAAARLLT